MCVYVCVCVSDRGGDLTHGRQEDQEEARDHGRADQRQGHILQALHMAGAASPGRLLQRGVHLKQGRRGNGGPDHEKPANS